MPTAEDLIERARMLEKRAERASDPISRQHYREMAAPTIARSRVGVSHLTDQPEHEMEH